MQQICVPILKRCDKSCMVGLTYDQRHEVCGVLTVTPLMGHVHTIVTVDQTLQCIVFTPFHHHFCNDLLTHTAVSFFKYQPGITCPIICSHILTKAELAVNMHRPVSFAPVTFGWSTLMYLDICGYIHLIMTAFENYSFIV